MVDNYDYFAIPDFLDRKKWTPAQWEQSKQAWQKIQQDAGRIARADRRDRGDTGGNLQVRKLHGRACPMASKAFGEGERGNPCV